MNDTEKTIKHDVTAAPTESVKTVEEFDALLERVKIQSPDSYKIQLENGEFERFRKTLVGYVPPAPPTPPAPEKTLEENSKAELVELASAKGLKLKGTENKAELVELLKTPSV